MTPSDDWDGAGLLGVTIKLDNYGGADERLIRVLDVEKGSPASIAGLVKDKDFMLGTTTQNFVSSATLAAVLEDNIDQVVEIYVYSSDSDIVRVVALVPTLSWGGAGLLGAEVGTGYLHRLPNSCRSTTGQSVERKVRWTNQNNGGGQATDSGIVEMEPHLEMEVEKDEVTGRTRQPHELGRSESPAVQKAKDAVDCQVPNSDRTNAPTLDELADNTRCLQVECEARIKADANSSAVSSARPLEPQIHQDEMRQMPAPPKMSY